MVICDLLSSLIPYLMVIMLAASLAVLLIRFCAEPFAGDDGLRGRLGKLLMPSRHAEEAPKRNIHSGGREKQSLRSLMNNSISFFSLIFLSRMVLLAVPVISCLFTGNLSKLFTDAILHWVRSDTGTYLNLARYNYETLPNLIHLLPLYPLAVKFVSIFTFGHYTLAGFIVSNCCLFGATWALYLLVVEQYGCNKAGRAVVFFLFSPLSIFFSVPCAESMFLMLTMFSILAARDGRYLLSGILGLLASLTRLEGVLTLIPVLESILVSVRSERQNNRNPVGIRKRLMKRLAWSLLIPAGTVLYLLLNIHITGSPFGFIGVLKNEMSQGIGSIWETESYSIRHAFTYSDITWRLGTWIPQAIAIFAAVLMVLCNCTKARSGDGLYALCYLLMTLLFTWVLNGTRMVLCMYPTYIMLADFMDTRKKRDVILTISLILMCFFSYMYAICGTVM